jgi:hypothetical protein
MAKEQKKNTNTLSKQTEPHNSNSSTSGNTISNHHEALEMSALAAKSSANGLLTSFFLFYLQSICKFLRGFLHYFVSVWQFGFIYKRGESLFRERVTEISRDKQLNYVNFKFFVALASHV